MDRSDDTALIERYLEFCRTQKGLSARTLDLYALHLQDLLARTKAASVELLCVENHHIRQWLMRLHSLGAAPRSMALTLSAWRGLFAWLGREGLVASNPVTDVRAVKVKKSLPKALAVDDAVRLADFVAHQAQDGRLAISDRSPLPSALRPSTVTESAIESAMDSVTDKLTVLQDGVALSGRSAQAEGLTAAKGGKKGARLQHWRAQRDTAMVELLYGCGLRVSELLALNVQADSDNSNWIDLDSAGAWAYVRGKGGKHRSVPVGSKAAQALAQWLLVRTDVQAMPSSPALFINAQGGRLTPQAVWQNLRRQSQEAGLATPVHPHILRHSCASHLLQSSGDLRGVQEFLGHASIATTQVYTRLDFQHLSSVYDKAHPRAHKSAAK